MITQIAYGGWARNIRLTNGMIELVATLEVGPRIIRLGFVDGPNVFKEYPEQMGGAREAEWQIRGGHRFWHAPEAKPRTYALDNGPVAFDQVNDFTLRLSPPPETENGVQKTLEIRMDPDAPVVSITHRLHNIGPWDIEVAPWALSVMTPGGMAIVPLPEKRPHTDVLTPDFPLVLWPYTDLADPRLRLGTRYITLAQDAARGPNKFGMLNTTGWAAYLVHGVLFAKYFDADPCAPYPDYGCNFETFTNEDMLEVESLGPLEVLEPGGELEHTETWKLAAVDSLVCTDEEIDRVIRPLIEG